MRAGEVQRAARRPANSFGALPANCRERTCPARREWRIMRTSKFREAIGRGKRREMRMASYARDIWAMKETASAIISNFRELTRRPIGIEFRSDQMASRADNDRARRPNWFGPAERVERQSKMDEYKPEFRGPTMPTSRARISSLIGAIALVMTFSAPARADCTSSLASFKSAIDRAALADARRLEDEIRDDPSCLRFYNQTRDDRIKLQLSLASSGRGPWSTQAEREAAIVEAASVRQTWRGQAALGDLRANQRKFPEAVAAYNEAIQRIGKPIAASDAEKQAMLSKVAAVKLLANDDDNGSKATTFQSTRDVSGAPSGPYSPVLRAVGVVKIPVPINFETASTNFTAIGAKAFEELYDALSGQEIREVTLIGHADQRGEDGYNMRLSEARVKRVAEELRRKGLNISMKVEWMGKRQPLDISALPFRPNETEMLALNRRVEIILPKADQ
jgi:outer membrane protein OmpA-like peptidoglycan-associated protein